MVSKSANKAVVPERLASGVLVFEDAPDFQPNLTPCEVLKLGSFGGSYFRNITSGVTKETYTDVWKELPKSWLEDLTIKEQVASSTYRIESNAYGVNCGVKAGKHDPFGLLYWESKNWMDAQDPYGWFQWYCRFFQGRRTDDDLRQISRWKKCAGVTGRWRANLVTKVMNQRASFDDFSVSPVVRQTLQHWAYRLTEADYKLGVERKCKAAHAVLDKAKPETKANAKRSIKTESAAAAPKSKSKEKTKATRTVKTEKEEENEEEEEEEEEAAPETRKRVKRE